MFLNKMNVLSEFEKKITEKKFFFFLPYLNKSYFLLLVFFIKLNVSKITLTLKCTVSKIYLDESKISYIKINIVSKMYFTNIFYC